MNVAFKITAALLRQLYCDLTRPHPFAGERVGFLLCRVASCGPLDIIILADSFRPVEDGNYLDDHQVGAMIGPGAIREALKVAYNDRVAMFHVHVHNHAGRPWFSQTDLRAAIDFVPDFWHVRPEFPHGALVLSLDSIAGLCWVPGLKQPVVIRRLGVVGYPLRLIGE